MKTSIKLIVALSLSFAFMAPVASSQTQLGLPNLPGTFASLPYSDGFEGHSGIVPAHMAVNELNAVTLARDPMAWCNIGQNAPCILPRSGSYNLEMGNVPNSMNFIDVLNGLVIGLDGTGYSGSLKLQFALIDGGEESDLEDGAWISDDGITYHKLLSWSGIPDNMWLSRTVDLDSTPVNPRGTFYLAFVQNDNFPYLDLDGIGIDEIEIPAPFPVVRYRGIENRSEGNSSLNLNGTTGFLEVRDLIAEPDGFALTLDQASGWMIDFADFLSPSNDPDGASLTAVSEYTQAGVSDRLEFRVSGSSLTVGADFSQVGASRKRVNVYNNGVLVYSYIHSESIDLTFPQGFPDKEDEVEVICIAPDSDSGSTCCPQDGTSVAACDPIYVVVTDQPTSAIIAGNTRVQGNGFTISPLERTIPPSPLTQVRFTGTGITELVIQDEGLGAGQFLHSGYGSAELDIQSGALKVSNVGSSGADGLEVKLSYGDDFMVEWKDLNSGPPPPDGAFLQLSSTGQVRGQAKQLLGQATFEDIGPHLRLTADFSPLGANTHVLEIFDDGVLVQRISNVSSPVLTVTEWPSGGGKIGPGGGTTCYAGCWDRDVTFSVAGSGAYSGDELRILAENPTERLDWVDGFSVLLKDIPEIEVIEETKSEALILHVSPLRSGAYSFFTVRNGSHGNQVTFLASLAGPGSGSYQGVPIDILFPIAIGTLGADITGRATMALIIPSKVHSRSVSLQAIHFDPVQAETTNVVSTFVQ